MAHDVFISYSHVDKPVADGICANLEAAGIRCWIAPRDIGPGEDWPAAITQAISRSRVMVLVFSSHSNASDEVSREVFLAADAKAVIIPFRIENVEPVAGKRYYLGSTHWLDAMNPPTREEIRMLVERVQSFVSAVAGNLGAPPAPLPRPPSTEVAMAGLQVTKKRLPWQWVLPAMAVIAIAALAGAWGLGRLRSSNAPPATSATEAASSAVSTPAPSASAAPTRPAAPTLTKQATATPAAQPTSVPWNVQITDDFTSLKKGWPLLENEDDGGSIQNMHIRDGVLTYQLDCRIASGCDYFYHQSAPPVSDFDVSLDVHRESSAGGGAYGILFRFHDDINFYTFTIDDAGQRFSVSAYQDGWRPIVDWTQSEAIRANETNRLAISARGSRFTFSVNDIVVAEAEDPGVASGRTGITAEVNSGGDSLSVVFDNFELRGRYK